jgi:hypothetical protein
MKRRSWFVLPMLGALVVCLGVWSSAQADHRDEAQQVAAEQAIEPQCTAAEAPGSALEALQPTETTDGQASLACPAGYAETCCWCGCGCRKITISPQNFCRFYWCPGP